MNNELEQFYNEVGTQAGTSNGEQNAWGGEVAAPSPILQQPTTPTGPTKAWASSGDKFWGISESQDTIPAGCYVTEIMADGSAMLNRQPLKTDSLILLPDSKSEAIVEEITHFTTLRPAFAQRGLLYKRGVLLWGPPGSGKTSTLHLLMDLIVKQLGGVALIIGNPRVAVAGLHLIRKIEPSRQVIGILEDIDGLISHYGVEEYLSLLDGEAQIDNVVFVATTNYPERLDRRFVDRPSRFDTVEYVGMPSAEAREVYLRHKEPGLDDAAITEMVEVSEGLSIAHLRELIILTQCFGRSIEDAAKRLTASKHRLPSSERNPDRGGFGFTKH